MINCVDTSKYLIIKNLRMMKNVLQLQFIKERKKKNENLKKMRQIR